MSSPDDTSESITQDDTSKSITPNDTYNTCSTTCFNTFKTGINNQPDVDTSTSFCDRSTQVRDAITNVMFNPDKDKCGWFHENSSQISNVLKQPNMSQKKWIDIVPMVSNDMMIMGTSVDKPFDKPDPQRQLELVNETGGCIHDEYKEGEYFSSNVNIVNTIDNFCKIQQD